MSQMNRSNFKIYNVPISTANTEVSQTLTPTPAFIAAKSRLLADFKLTMTSGESGTTYWTVFGGGVWESPGMINGTKTLYIQSGTPGDTIEIEEWT